MAAERHVALGANCMKALGGEVELQKGPFLGGCRNFMQYANNTTFYWRDYLTSTRHSCLLLLGRVPPFYLLAIVDFLPRLQRPRSFPSSDPVMKICFLILVKI